MYPVNPINRNQKSLLNDLLFLTSLQVTVFLGVEAVPSLALVVWRWEVGQVVGCPCPGIASLDWNALGNV